MQKERLQSTKRKIISFLCFFCISFCAWLVFDGALTKAVAETAGDSMQHKETKQQEQLQLYAKSALLMDTANQRVLYEKNGYEVLPMASTTKIMTAVLALEYGNLEDEVTVSAYAASRPKVRLGMKEGEVYKLKDLLFSLMLESHNDSAVAIAEHIGGSTEGFAEMMNQKARDLGCQNTYFITPNGLDAEKGGKIHSTTAHDLAVIASYAIQNDMFVALVGTEDYAFSEKTTGRRFAVDNKDQFLHMMDGAIGIKTGYTNDAGYCFVGAVKKEDRTLVSVVLASGWPPHKNYKWSDTKTLMKMGVEDYEVQCIEEPALPETIKITEGVEQAVGVDAPWEETNLLLADWDQVEVKIEMKESLEAPVEEGEIVGYEKIMVNGQVLGMVPIETTESMERYTFMYCVEDVLERFLWGS